MAEGNSSTNRIPPERPRRQCALNVGYGEGGKGISASSTLRTKRLLPRYKDWIWEFKDQWKSQNGHLPTKQQVTITYSQSYVTELHYFLAVYDPTIVKNDVVKWVHDHKWIRDITADKSNSDPSSTRKRPRAPGRGPPSKKASGRKKRLIHFEPILSHAQPEEVEQRMVTPHFISPSTVTELVKSVFGPDVECNSSEAEDRDDQDSPPMGQNQPEEENEMTTNAFPVELPPLQLSNGGKDDTFPIVEFDKKVVHRGRKEFLLRSLREQADRDNGKEADYAADAADVVENARQQEIEEGRHIFNRMNAAASATTSDSDVEVMEVLSSSPVPVNECSEETSSDGMSSMLGSRMEIDLPTSSTSIGSDSDSYSNGSVSPVDMTMPTLSIMYSPEQSAPNPDSED